MLASILFFLTAGVSTGVYTFPELAIALTKATGEKYELKPLGFDPAIFVSVKNDDPERVKKLVAASYRAKWIKKDEVWTLIVDADPSEEEQKDFEETFRASCPEDSILKSVPFADIYMVDVGKAIRYGDSPRFKENRLPFPKKAESNETRSLILHRHALGYFECRENGKHFDLKIKVLSKKVVDLLKQKIDDTVIGDEEKKKIKEWTRDFKDHKFTFLDPKQKSPFMRLAEIMFPPLAKDIDQDIVIPVYDSTWFALPELTDDSTTVRQILSSLSSCMLWKIEDGGLVGLHHSVENPIDTQSNRDYMRAVVRDYSDKGFSRRGGIVWILRDFMTGARSGTDQLVLAAEGIELDDGRSLDFPYNFALAVYATDNDKEKLEPFERIPLDQFSSSTIEAALGVLLHSRARVAKGSFDINMDPGWWPSLDPRDLYLSYNGEKEYFLVSTTSSGSELLTPYEAGRTHVVRVRQLGRRFIYGLVARRKSRFIIGSLLSNQSVKTSYTRNWLFDAEIAIPNWQMLPEIVQSEFERGLKDGP